MFVFLFVTSQLARILPLPHVLLHCSWHVFCLFLFRSLVLSSSFFFGGGGLQKPKCFATIPRVESVELHRIHICSEP